MLEKLYRLLKELAGFNRKPMPVLQGIAKLYLITALMKTGPAVIMLSKETRGDKK